MSFCSVFVSLLVAAALVAGDSTISFGETSNGKIVFAFSPVLEDPSYQYWDLSAEGLKFGFCQDATCNDVGYVTISDCIVSYIPFDQQSSLAIDSNDRVWMAFTETDQNGQSQQRELTLAICETWRCASFVTIEVESQGFSPSLVLSDDKPVVFYVDAENGGEDPPMGAIKVTVCNDENCDDFDQYPIDYCGQDPNDNEGGVCTRPVGIILPNGNPAVAYLGPDTRNFTQEYFETDEIYVKVAICREPRCEEEPVIVHLDLIEDGSDLLPYHDSHPAITIDPISGNITVVYNKGISLFSSSVGYADCEIQWDRFLNESIPPNATVFSDSLYEGNSSSVFLPNCFNNNLLKVGATGTYNAYPNIAKDSNGDTYVSYIAVDEDGTDVARVVNYETGETYTTFSGEELLDSALFITSDGDAFVAAFSSESSGEILASCGSITQCSVSSPTLEISEAWPQDCAASPIPITSGAAEFSPVLVVTVLAPLLVTLF